MGETLIGLLESWGVSKAAEQVEYLMGSTIPFAIWETLYVTVLATVFAYLIGLPLGVILVTGEAGGIRPLPAALMKVLNVVVNLLRSVPFTILMVCLFPPVPADSGHLHRHRRLHRPPDPGGGPLRGPGGGELPAGDGPGRHRAAEAMGCTPWQIVTKVLLPECRPSLITGCTTATITILSYGAMAGAIGGGGLGSMALMLGYQRRMYIVMYVSVLVLVILVQIFQTVGTHMAVRLDRRITDKEEGRRRRKDAKAKVKKGRRFPYVHNP